MSVPEGKLPLHERLAEGVKNAVSSWAFFGLLNAASASYILYQEFGANPFDKYPFTFMNLILAILTFDLEILIMIAQRAAERVARRQEFYALSIAEADLELARNTVAVLSTLKEMQEAGTGRDMTLHDLIERLDRNESAQTDMIRELRERIAIIAGASTRCLQGEYD